MPKGHVTRILHELTPSKNAEKISFIHAIAVNLDTGETVTNSCILCHATKRLPKVGDRIHVRLNPDDRSILRIRRILINPKPKE